MYLQGEQTCLVLRAEKGIRKIPLKGVIPGILILVQPLPDLIGIIQFFFSFYPCGAVWMAWFEILSVCIFAMAVT